MYPEHIKRIAYRLDPPCWVSYSGQSREYKAIMERRRKAALAEATANYKEKPMARKSLSELIDNQINEKAEAQLRDAALTAAASIMRKIVSREEWINNRKKQLKSLQGLYEKLEKAYQRGDLATIKEITSELTKYVEAYNIDELIHSGAIRMSHFESSKYTTEMTFQCQTVPGVVEFIERLMAR